jgi:peptidoglycan/LPS O-acetylase OafA/YrhL
VRVKSGLRLADVLVVVARHLGLAFSRGQHRGLPANPRRSGVDVFFFVCFFAAKTVLLQ